jgi:hypothetical protein
MLQINQEIEAVIPRYHPSRGTTTPNRKSTKLSNCIRRTAMSAYGPFYSDQQLQAPATFVRRIDNLPDGLMERIQAKTPPAESSKLK